MFLYNTASRILFVNKLYVDLVFNIPSGIKKLFKFLKKNIHIEADGFVVFYIQKCLFVSFLRLHSPLCALKI